MNNIIDLTPKLNRHNQPDADQVFVDEHNRSWYHYLCHYQFNDIEAMKETAVIDGQCYAEIDYD